MKGLFSLFSRQGSRRKKTKGEWTSAPRSSSDEQRGRSLPPEMTDNVRDNGSAEKPDAPISPLNEGTSTEKGIGSFLRMVTGPDRDLFPDSFRFFESGRGGCADEEGQGEFYTGPVFRAEVRDEDIPFRRSGFAAQASGEWQGAFRESFRILFDRAEETKKILFQLTETADEIRKELTI